MRYRVQHTTRYAYGTPVELAAHMVHLRPRPWQTVISEQITTDPIPARRRDGLDHFGNHVTWLFLDLPHADFEVTSESIAQVDCPPPPETAETLPWEEVVQAARTHDGWQAGNSSSPPAWCWSTPPPKTYVEKSFTANCPVLAALLDLNDRFQSEFRFRSGVTTISTPVSQVMAHKEGVCQDFSHAMISGLRGIGVPARYTSGYIRTKLPPGQARRRGADQSHAWVGAWLGTDHGWVDVDPTNGIVVKDEHVLLGWGRDFGDVSPARRVILGGGDHVVAVAVDLEPVDWEATP
jgi:transglutaminase-like putative cysteine protease